VGSNDPFVEEYQPMRFHADTGYPFDTNNRAYQRLLTVSAQHLETLSWTRDDGRPVMLTLYDLATGDAITIALLDSIEAHRAHALLVLRRDGTPCVHGPFDGESAAAAHAPTVALTDPSVAATLPLPLHHPGDGELPPDDAWRPLHQQAVVRTTTAAAPARPAHTALVLLDRQRQRLAVVGPFPDHTAALRWEPATFPHADVDCVIVPMHVDVTVAPAVGDGDGGHD
jgi:hypothetical protein